jgi:hypothetical protein
LCAQKTGILFEKSLKDALGFVPLLNHLDEVLVASDKVDFTHRKSLISALELTMIH